MSSLVEVMNGLSGNLPLVLLNVAWQCAAVFLVAFAAIKLSRPRSPLTRHLVWLLALAGMGACPLIATSGLVGSIQLVRMPLALDSTPDATQAPLPELALGNDAPEPDALTAVYPSHAESPGTPPQPLAGTTTPRAERAANHQDEPRVHAASSAAPLTAPAESARAPRLSWSAFVGAVWALGALLLVVRLIVAQRAVLRLIRRSAVPRNARLLRAFASARAMAGVKRDVALRVSDDLAVPVAAGLFRPCVLFPTRLVEQLPVADIETIAVHELTHISRMDPVVIVVQRLIEAVLFFHPAVWLVSRALAVAREELCDEAVVHATRKPVTYAKCLTSLFEQVRVLSHCRVASVGIAHYRSKLFQRVETLLSGRMLLLRRLPHGVKAAVVGVACAALILIGGTTFVRGQATDAAEPDTTTADQDTSSDVVTATVKQASEPYRWVNETTSCEKTVGAVALCVSSPDVLYAATPSGVFKSTDGAATWAPTALAHKNVNLAYVDVAVDCANPDLVYAAFRDFFRSRDGGASWTRLEPGGSNSVCDVLVDPKLPGVAYLRDRQNGVFKTTDGGATWQPKNTGFANTPFMHFEMDPHSTQTLSALTYVRYAQYDSEDGGVTWEETGGSIGDVVIRSLTRDPENPDRVTVTFDCRGDECTGEHSFESTNPGSGKEWDLVSDGKCSRKLSVVRLDVDRENPKSMQLFFRAAGTLSVTRDGAETWRVIDTLPFDLRKLSGIRVDPVHDDILYAGTTDNVFYYSDDGGTTWEFFYSAEFDPDAKGTKEMEVLRTCFFYGLDDVDIRRDTLITHPTNPAIAYHYRDYPETLWKTEDSGTTWTQVTGGLVTFEARGIACDSQTPGLVYTGGRSCIRRSSDGGRAWVTIVGMTSCTPLILHPLEPQTLLLCGKVNRVCISTDGGETWKQPLALDADLDSDFDSDVEGFVFDPENADTFYVLSRKGIFETTDHGETWKATGGSFTTSSRWENWPGTSQTRADIIYAVDGKALLRSTDIGQTWEEVMVGEDKETRIRFADVHPADPKLVVVGKQDGSLYLTRDAGTTWQAVETAGSISEMKPRCVGFDPEDSDVFYIGAEVRRTILRTRDGGETFEELSEGLPDANIMQIVVSPADGAVYAGTESAGVYRLEIEKPASDEGGDE